MWKRSYKPFLIVTATLWTAGVLYGSLSPGDDLPKPWWAEIADIDKLIHFCFYGGEVTLLMLLFELRGWRKLWILLPVVALSGVIEWLQEAYFERTADLFDMLANLLGALFGLWLGPRIGRWLLFPLFGIRERESKR